MIDWIEKNIDPPGIEKKNRFALFKTIADIMGRVRIDAIKAFNAHFPYLADEKKLEEHGKVLIIPHLINDKPEEYRNRVTAASFFLMKAGERGFIMDVLKERFGDRFKVMERFLQLQTKIADLTKEEKIWVYGLLDSLIDPNVSLELSQWFRCADEMPIQDLGIPVYELNHWLVDYIGSSIFYDGSYCYDGTETYGPRFSDELKIDVQCTYYYYDGTYCYDGSIPYGRYL